MHLAYYRELSRAAATIRRRGIAVCSNDIEINERKTKLASRARRRAILRKRKRSDGGNGTERKWP